MNEYINNLRLIEVVEISGASERLRNAIKDGIKNKDISFNTLGEFLKFGMIAFDELDKTPNIGKKSLNEFEQIIEYLTTEKFQQLTKTTHQYFTSLDSSASKILNPLIEQYNFSLKHFESPYEKLKCIKISNILEQLLNSNKYYLNIIRRVYLCEPLESIANDYGITSATVRNIYSRYKEYILPKKEWLNLVIDELTTIDSNVLLPSNETLNKYHPNLQCILGKEFLNTDVDIYWEENLARVRLFFENDKANLSSEGRYKISKLLKLECDHEFKNFTRWTIERTIYETKQAAIKLGTPQLMPKQIDIKSLGLENLRGAIGKFGGQSKVAELAGLEYQGQMVAPNGKRRYWTNRRIKSFLNKVAKLEGHPCIMPTQAECKKYAPVPGTIIANITKSSSKIHKTLSWKQVAALHGLEFTPR